MPGHYSWKSKELGNYRNYMDSIYPEMSSVVKKVVYSIPWHSNQLSLDKGMMLEDIKTIKADFLIRHIDNAINMWQQSSWLRDVTFEKFCEYLLPYRVGDEPLIDMDSTLYWWKEVKQEMDVYGFTPLFLDEIRHFLKNKIGESDNRYFTNLDFGKNISRKYTMDCLDMCYYDVIGLRQAGVPSTIDLVPNWATRNGRHYWRSIYDEMCVNDNYSETLNSLPGKVYRMTYSHNPIPKSNGIDSIPVFFQNPFMKDVSDKYMKTSEVEINLNKKSKDSEAEHIYLAVFNDLEWKPIA